MFVGTGHSGGGAVSPVRSRVRGVRLGLGRAKPCGNVRRKNLGGSLAPTAGDIVILILILMMVMMVMLARRLLVMVFILFFLDCLA